MLYNKDGQPATIRRDREALANEARRLLAEAKASQPLNVRRTLKKLRYELNREIRRAEASAAEKPERLHKVSPDRGVYVVGVPGGPVKVGIATDIASRLSGIQTGCTEKLKVYVFIDGLGHRAREIERECHRRLDQHRIKGEWFNVDWREAVALVRSLTA